MMNFQITCGPSSDFLKLTFIVREISNEITGVRVKPDLDELTRKSTAHQIIFVFTSNRNLTSLAYLAF